MRSEIISKVLSIVVLKACFNVTFRNGIELIKVTTFIHFSRWHWNRRYIVNLCHARKVYWNLYSEHDSSLLFDKKYVDNQHLLRILYQRVGMTVRIGVILNLKSVTLKLIFRWKCVWCDPGSTRLNVLEFFMRIKRLSKVQVTSYVGNVTFYVYLCE